MSTAQALSAPQGLSMPTAKKIFAFASMCVGMFIALIVWGGDRLCMDGSSPRKQREALRDKA